MMMKKYSRFSFLLLVTAFLCFFVLPSVAAERIVDNSGDLNPGSIVEPVYPTIQAAVDGAVSGDMITVRAGTYRENVKVSGKSLTFVTEGEVNLTVPEPDFTPAGYAEWDDDLPDMTSPVISVDRGSADNVQISFTGFNFVALDSKMREDGELVSAGIFAGAGTSLTVSDCGFNGAFMVPVLVTTYEDIFNDMVFDEFGTRSVSDSDPASLEITGCTMENYVLAGVSLVGPNVTGDIVDNSFAGTAMMESASMDLDPAMAVDSFRSALMSGTLFSQGLDAQSSRYLPFGGAGVLLLNSSDGYSEDVTLTGNTITGNLLGIGILKDFRVVDEFDLQMQEDPDPDTVISGNDSISENLVGIAVIGGFNEPLEWSEDYGIYLVEDLGDWHFSRSNRTYVDITDEEDIEGNMVGLMLLGGVEAHVDSCYFTDNLLAGLVALGDLDGSVIRDNVFSGTLGVNLLYGLGSSFWNMFAPKGAIGMEYAVSITGNRFMGNGLIEGAHEFIRDFVEGEGEGEPLSVLSSMGTRIASGGPLAFLPSGISAAQQPEGTPTLAGIVLLDGASYVRIEDNLVTDSLLGVTAMDLGLDNILDEISDGDIDLHLGSGLSDVLIQNNEITGNLSGLNLIGARELVRDALYDGSKMSLDPSFDPFIEYNIGLEDFVVRGNNISQNHFGVVNALDVQDLSFTGNSVDNNLVLGMLNAGMGAWAFEEAFDNSDYYRGSIPSAEIFGNSVSYNGTVDGDLDDLPIGTETLGTYVKGGVAVFDVPGNDFARGEFSGAVSSLGISLKSNSIQGNGNYGLLVVGRVGELRPKSTELVSTDLFFDATENFWGDVTGPSSYFGEASELIFTDPMTAESADNEGDAISGVVFEEDGQYYPYDFMADALYVRPLNCILFDEWLGDDGEDVQAVVGAKVSAGEESRVGRDLGNGNSVNTTVIAGENGFDWTLTRLGSKPAGSSALKVSAGGYYRFDVTYPGNVSEVKLKFGYSSSNAPDFFWFDRTTGEWIKLVPSDTGKEYLEFIFNDKTNPTLSQLFNPLGTTSFGPSKRIDEFALFAQSGANSGGGSSSGGGGCNIAWAGVPSIALLLPLMMLFLKK